jgi:Holliday junction resolvase
VRRNAKIDSTHSDIVNCLRKLGFSVFSLAMVGRGFPDIVLARGGNTWLAEIKSGKLGWKLTPQQRKFHQNWSAPILIFDSVEAVLMWANDPRGAK